MSDEQKINPENTEIKPDQESPQSSMEKTEGNALNKEKEQTSEVSSAEKDDAYAKILSKVQDQGEDENGGSDVKTDAKTTSGKMDAESQVQNLVDIAMNKGVIHSVKVAKHLEDNYVLDMFHDKLLADELHNALTEKGLIKNI